jgi:predicted NAD-dependent protein-ADP-ribosyltransferase YbiA (DUF1768 family)
MKHLYVIRFNHGGDTRGKAGVEGLALHVAVSAIVVDASMKPIWGVGAEAKTEDLLTEVALDRALAELRPRLKEFISAYRVPGKCL